MEAVGLPVLLPGCEHGFRRLLDAYAGRAGHGWRVVAEVDALPHVKRGVAAGLAHIEARAQESRRRIAAILCWKEHLRRCSYTAQRLTPWHQTLRRIRCSQFAIPQSRSH